MQDIMSTPLRKEGWYVPPWEKAYKEATPPLVLTFLLHRKIQAQSKTYTCEIPLAPPWPLVHSENKQLVRKDILIPLRLPPVGYSLLYTLMCYTSSNSPLARYVQLGKILVLPLVSAPPLWPRSHPRPRHKERVNAHHKLAILLLPSSCYPFMYSSLFVSFPWSFYHSSILAHWVFLGFSLHVPTSIQGPSTRRGV